MKTSDYDAQPTGHMPSNRRVFVIVFVMLCGLTAISFWIANSDLMENRSVAWTAMIAISVCQGDVGRFVLHAFVVGKGLEVCIDDSCPDYGRDVGFAPGSGHRAENPNLLKSTSTNGARDSSRRCGSIAGK
jgi:hypothetical protein